MSKDILKLKSDAIDATISARRLEEKELGDLVEKIKEHMNFLMLHVAGIDHKKLSDIAGALAQIHSLSSSPIYSAILKAVEKNT